MSNRQPGQLSNKSADWAWVAETKIKALKDYERVKLLLRGQHSADEISQLIDRGKRVVLEYIEIAREFHPELFAAETTQA